MPQSHDTVLEVDLGALAHNYRLLRSRLLPETRFLGVVKAYAYGSDSLAIAKKLESLGADYLAVAFTDEGVFLREGGIRLPILVLHPQPSGLGDLITHCLEPSLYSPRILRLFLQEAKARKQKDFPVHLKFNTGLNRLGFWENDVDWIQGQLDTGNTLSIRSVLSHLAASDDLGEAEFTRRQIDGFTRIVGEVREKLPGSPFFHLLNTSGIFNYPDAQWDMVRSGIGLYGYGNDQEYDKLLRPVARLRTRISQLHKIEPGEWVGYNKGFESPGYRTTATLPIGHADGIGRIYGKGRGIFHLHGKPAPIIGNVCMDMTMIDVTDIPCREGDEVVVYGGPHSAEVLARGAGTISYELLTGISRRVAREIRDES
ncbi:alanine racemase [Robiginitalea sp. SC105]|uniref:alanine racemase n=1 Tax=Robiginitalea sp. SC105 TaxID=2762332 RepID=UPI001639DA45|nr:alanine racemase [Robiginitalea sp. SC105]MBC2838090.1 alanine racemase [Robiginitalea sp. SC105]